MIVTFGCMGAAKFSKSRRANLAISQKMATKWGALFDVPPTWLMTIAEMESSHDPSKVNPAVKTKGGAWGLYQQMFDEIPYKIGVIQKFHAKRSPEIKKTLKLWKGKAQNLLNPDLNAMIAAWQLGRLRKIFDDDLETVAAAYHQGENAVKRRIDAGQPAVSENQPKGMEYVAKVTSTFPKYETLLAMND